jgi:hypothetical protein
MVTGPVVLISLFCFLPSPAIWFSTPSLEATRVNERRLQPIELL